MITALAIFLLLNTYDEGKEAKELKFHNNGEVINLTSSEEAGEILRTGLQVIGLDSVEVTLVDIQWNGAPNIKKGPLVEEAFIVNPRKGEYTIFINPDHKTEVTIDIISHELIHLIQYKEDRLKRIGGGLVIFEGDTINIKNTPYLSRA